MHTSRPSPPCGPNARRCSRWTCWVSSSRSASRHALKEPQFSGQTKERLSSRDEEARGIELATALLDHIAPGVVSGNGSALSRDRGRDLYYFIMERILHLVDAAPEEVK